MPFAPCTVILSACTSSVRRLHLIAEALKKAGVQTRFTHYTDKGHMGITDDVIRDARNFIAEVEKK